MKKKGLIIASLLVLVMSFMFIGCPDGDPEDEPDPGVTYTPVSSAALTDLKDKIGYTGTLISPDCDFRDYKYSKDADGYENIVIAWKDGDATKLAAYQTAWGDKVKTNVSVARDFSSAGGFFLTIKDKDDKAFNTAKISLVESDGTEKETGHPVKANDILFIIYK